MSLRQVCGRKEEVSIKYIFQEVVDEGGERMYEDMVSDEGGLGRDEMVEGEDVGVKTGGKKLVCCDKVGEEIVFAVTDANGLTDGGEEVEEETELKMEA